MAGAAEVSRDLGLGDAAVDQVLGGGDMLRGEPAGPTAVDALGFGDLDAFALSLSDEGALEMGDGAEQVQRECREGAFGAGVGDEPLGDELDSDPAAGHVLHELGEVDDERASRSIEATRRRDARGAAAAPGRGRSARLFPLTMWVKVSST